MDPKVADLHRIITKRCHTESRKYHEDENPNLEALAYSTVFRKANHELEIMSL